MRDFVAFLVLFACCVAGVNIPYTNCTKSATDVNIESATISMWPPVKGKPFDLSIQGSLLSSISGGNFKIEVTFDGIPIQKSGTIQELAKLAHITLPIPAGPFNLTKDLTIPSGVPSSSISVRVDAQDQNNYEILCIELSIKISEDY